MPEATDLRLMTRAGGALALMSARYWTTVALRTHRQLRRWRKHAQAIPDPTLRALAHNKLTEERFNAYFAPTFATLAHAARRPLTIEAIVALQVTYDYLDGLSEQPASEPLRDGHALFHALTDAVSLSREPHEDYYRHHPHCEDGGYLRRLVAATRGALGKLPARSAIGDAASAAAARCAGAQVRAHAAPNLGDDQLERWASGQAGEDGTPWCERVASAASAVISMHALIAAAADPRTTPEQAARIDAFHRSTCALATILDGLVDRVEDERRGEDRRGYLRHYPDRDHLSTELANIARRARSEAHRVPHGDHHLMTLAGVVSYYTTALDASECASKAIVASVQRELQPLIAPTLAFMGALRRVKRLGERASERARPREEAV